MKKLVLFVACAIVSQLASVQEASSHPRFHRGGVTFAVFYESLSPYGEWIAVGGGVYAWRPVGVVVGWRPYTVGRWVWTEYGWYWVSDEPWGWAVFHYGRWYYDDFYGWIWIPGYDWAPAWVEWRYGGDYIGWAPLGPYAVFSIHWGIHYRTRWYTPHHWWSFVHCRYVSSPHLHRYVYRPEENTRYIGVTRTGGSVRYAGGRIVTRGPEREFVERQGRVRLEPVRIREVTDTPVERIVREDNREQIEVYRPRIEERADDEAAAIRPPRVRVDGGRSLDLDVRKIDLRAREAANDDIRRADKARAGEARPEPDRTGEHRDRGMLKGPVDDGIRDRGSRGREDEEVRSLYDSRRDGRSRQAVPGEEQVRRVPDRIPGTQRDARERKRDESYSVPQRDDTGWQAPARPERTPHMRSPERRAEPPRQDAIPRQGPTRDPGGRSGRGR